MEEVHPYLEDDEKNEMKIESLVIKLLTENNENDKIFDLK